MNFDSPLLYIVVIIIFIAAMFFIINRKNSTVNRLNENQYQDSHFEVGPYKENEEIRKLISENRKIQAIKKFRELNPHLRLKDAVQYIDDCEKEMEKNR